MWRYVLPYVGAPHLSLCFLCADMVHLVAYVATARGDPGLLRFTPQQSELLVASGVQAVLCPHTGVALNCRSKYVPYIGEVVARFDHYCDWVHNAIGARNHVRYLVLMLAQTVTAIDSLPFPVLQVAL